MSSNPVAGKAAAILPKTAQGNYTPSMLARRGPFAGLPKRPEPDRTRFLTPRQVRELVNAEAFGERQGLSFAVHVTIHWQCDPAFNVAAWGERMTRFLDKLGRWLDRHGIPVAYAYAHEVGSRYGEHTHLALHLPKAKRDVIQSYHALKAELEAWIIETEDFATDKTDWRGKPWPPVTITPDKPHNFGTHTPKMRAGVFAYLLEGVDPSDVTYRGHGAEQRAAAMGVRPKLNAGLVLCKRSGASRSLGHAARRKAGWREVTDLEAIYGRLKPG